MMKMRYFAVSTLTIDVTYRFQYSVGACFSLNKFCHDFSKAPSAPALRSLDLTSCSLPLFSYSRFWSSCPRLGWVKRSVSRWKKGRRKKASRRPRILTLSCIQITTSNKRRIHFGSFDNSFHRWKQFAWHCLPSNDFIVTFTFPSFLHYWHCCLYDRCSLPTFHVSHNLYR